jgi:hypothetical protein
MIMRTLLVALAVAALPATAMAQGCMTSPCDGTLTASGTVASSVAWSQIQPLNFGPMVGATTVAPTASTSGRMRITHNQTVTLTVTFPPNLANGTSVVPVTAPACGYGSTAEPTAPTTMNCGGESVPAGGASTTYLYVGATAAPAAGLPAGVYTGTITFRATYPVF